MPDPAHPAAHTDADQARAERVTRAACRAIEEHLGVTDDDIAFAGLLRRVGGAGSLLDLHTVGETPELLTSLAYQLLMRAAARFNEAGDEAAAEIVCDALEELDALNGAPERAS